MEAVTAERRDLTAAAEWVETEVVVLGAGVSGLVAASVLHDQGVKGIQIVDEYPAVGGNHIDISIGDYTFDVGSFIFQDDSPLLDHFPELLAGYQEIKPSWARLNPQRMVTQYPFSIRDDLLAAGPVEVARIIASAAWARITRRKPLNARDFAERWVGARFLRRSGLENYMTRLCGCPVESIELSFAESRMGWIREHTQLKAIFRMARVLILHGSPEPASNKQLSRPRAGFASLYAPVVRALEARGSTFSLGENLVSIKHIGEKFKVETSGQVILAGRVFSTVPLAVAADACGVPFQPLPTITLISLFFSFQGERGFAEAILYNFSYSARWKRLTVYSDFYGEVAGRAYFAVEVVADPCGTTVDEAVREFRDHTRGNRLFSGDLRLEGSNILKHAYPIFVNGSTEASRKAIGDLREFGIESFGRQGAFRYQPTARVSAVEAAAALGRDRPAPVGLPL